MGRWVRTSETTLVHGPRGRDFKQVVDYDMI